MAVPAAPVAAAPPFAARMAGFVGHLRLNGFALGPEETAGALRVVEGGPHTTAEARRRLRCLLAGRREEWQRFDALFEAYWFGRGRVRERVERPRHRQQRNRAQQALWRGHLGDEAASEPADARGPRLESAAGAEAEGESSGRLIASRRQVLRRTDLRHVVDPAEMAAAEELAFRLASAIRYRLSRRQRIAPRGRRLDLRRTIRRSLAQGGEPLRLAWRERPDRPVRLVVFLDVSGSMQHYSRFFLQFVKGLVGRWAESDAYLLHTRLVRVTDALRERDSLKAMTQLALLAEGFGGGTRLGEGLAAFNAHYAKRALNARSVVLILSDGYDTGSPEALAAALGRLKKRAPRLIWLNPLLGWRDYRPVTAAMQAALPYIDHFAAANTLDALAALEPELATL
ncbi:Uncharacterized conserved protein, contains von Willebrand factor type A (vWA) domain [Tistlia consotensis]|uniref:Uncharacterized conserved protein, contains von Willebrand factor type A (VWA) domain n=1 Tax=Tistlia consotensis USBA 355 TaxID=560819 RepID=A0A1Y6CPR5_9PROT|nr:VWA domain-containing protein [Tistlia consotensis]SMF64425.1 Uncharacterized conserved protein, contains von Willebrand factor type A (vWA) domain [Tistlia consotensis USBA 355]SNR97503.1 Uncharacterized conserved protein, contains von Willebrand factor type A (vWA) domain [Tistlia consotensis]